VTLLVLRSGKLFLKMSVHVFTENEDFKGLGSPTSGKVLREAAGAVHSVFPPAELTR